jgi:protein-L-isoaspartate O-methyltransferase
MAVPHANYAALLAVVESVINARQMQPREDFLSPTHIQAAISHRALALGGVSGNAHLFIVATFNQRVNVAARGRAVG